jgi:hypothetical protein
MKIRVLNEDEVRVLNEDEVLELGIKDRLKEKGWFGGPDKTITLSGGTYGELETVKELLIEMAPDRGNEIQIFAEDDQMVDVHSISMNDLIEFLITEFLRGGGESIEEGYWRKEKYYE